jgi:hypothetical protein
VLELLRRFLVHQIAKIINRNKQKTHQKFAWKFQDLL